MMLQRKRSRDVVVGCPIIYGSVAHYLGKKAAEFATHKWTLFIRGPNNEDLSIFVAKVAFTLHSSFAQPVREVTSSPFEVSEMGWGEFEARIRIFFKDHTEQPIDLFHTIRLYPPGMPQQLSQKKPVVAEQYDEIVFSEPDEKFLRLLMSYTPRIHKQREDSKDQEAIAAPRADDSSSNRPKHAKQARVAALHTNIFNEFSTIFDDSMDLEALSVIQDHLTREIEVAKIQLLDLETQVVDLKYNVKRDKELAAASSKQYDGTSAFEAGAAAATAHNTGTSSGASRSSKSRSRGSSSGKPSRSSNSKAQQNVESSSSQQLIQMSEALGANAGSGAATMQAAPKKKRPPRKKPARNSADSVGLAVGNG